MLDIFFNRNQGACFQVIIATVFYQIFNSLTRSGKKLYFVKDNNAISYIPEFFNFIQRIFPENSKSLELIIHEIQKSIKYPTFYISIPRLF